MRRTSTIIILTFLLVCLGMEALPRQAWAQTGKLSGRVIDEQGASIPGATVLVTETQQGAATDSQGRYSIIGISPGTYTIRVSFVGFTTKLIEGVLVTSDRTQNLDVTLTEEVVQGGEVVVEAVRPVVDPNQTSSRALVTGEEISRLPVTTLQDVIARTSNAYDGFIRGSRRFEAKTILEGIDVSDSFYGLAQNASNQGATYDNTNRADETNASIFSINPDAVSEVTVNTGATDARYATGSGGVVAISLAERRGPIKGTFSARFAPTINVPGPDSLAFYPSEEVGEYFALRDQLKSDPGTQSKAALFNWSEDKYAFSDDPEADVRFSLGGSITDRWTFLASGQWFQTNGYQPNQFSKRLGGSLKTSYTLSDKTRLSAVAIVEDQGLWGNWNNRSYSDYWRYYLEGLSQNDGGSYLGSLKWTQVMSGSSYFSVQAYRTYQRSRYGYVDDDGNGFTDQGEDGDFIDFTDPANIDKYIGAGEEGKMFARNISNGFADITGITLPGGSRLRAGQPVPYSEDASNTLNGLKFDYSNQINFNHFLQTGVEVKVREFDYQQVYGIDTPGAKLNGDEEPFVPSNWNRTPWEVALYASDRMEYAGLVVNLGLRVEFANRDAEEIVDYFYPFRQDSVTVGGTTLQRQPFNRGDDVPTDVFLNPRIGVSHPIGSNAAMYFSYARNQQLVPFAQLYEWYDGNNSNNSFFSYQNPSQDPITSNNYELGIQWEFAEGWGTDINAYMRSIDNYGSINFEATNRVPEGAESLVGSPHRFRTSFGYADSRGIELILRRQAVELAQDLSLGLTASYTFS
ncbi:MAG TPA: TonB-dependent receptor, partial [Rhodothermales bacterium]|nr:TonB-dependent receptor [Rhodothermales bacterium]